MQRAVQSFDRAVELDGSARAYAARARAWFVLDRMDRYIVDVETALRKDSLLPEANYQRALYAMRSGDPRMAERRATTAIEGAVDTDLLALAQVLRGMARADLHQRKEAITDLQEGLKERPDDVEALRLLARLLDEEGRHEEALAVLEVLCDKEPGDLGNWTNRGFELAALGRHEEAITMYDHALTIDRDEPVALSNRAASLLALGRDDEALKEVERSLRGYPANPRALHTRARLLLAQGERGKACEDLTLARALGGGPEVDRLHQEHCAGTGER